QTVTPLLSELVQGSSYARKVNPVALSLARGRCHMTTQEGECLRCYRIPRAFDFKEVNPIEMQGMGKLIVDDLDTRPVQGIHDLPRLLDWIDFIVCTVKDEEGRRVRIDVCQRRRTQVSIAHFVG